MAVAGVDETLGATIAERVDMVEIGRAVNDAHVDRGNQRLAARLDSQRCPRAQCCSVWRRGVRRHGWPVALKRVQVCPGCSTPLTMPETIGEWQEPGGRVSLRNSSAQCAHRQDIHGSLNRRLPPETTDNGQRTTDQ